MNEPKPVCRCGTEMRYARMEDWWYCPEGLLQGGHIMRVPDAMWKAALKSGKTPEDLVRHGDEC